MYYNMYDSKNVARGMKSTFMLFSQSEAYFNSLTTYHLTLYISISFYLSLSFKNSKILYIVL